MKSGKRGVRKNAYRMYPGGRIELVWVDPVYMTILDDVEEVESMLNSGHKVYADRDMMEKSWKGRNNTMNKNVTELKEKELKQKELNERLELLELMLVAMNIVVQGHNGIIAKLANEVERLESKVDLLEKEKV